MEYLFLGIALLCAGLGIYLLVDFGIWLRSGRVTGAVIKGFAPQRNKGKQLPVVSFVKEDGGTHETRALRIDRFMYVMSRPIVDGFTMVIYKKADPGQVRVYGYINVVAAGFLFVPLMMALAVISGRTQTVAQVIYMLFLGVILVGGWMALKAIQRRG